MTNDSEAHDTAEIVAVAQAMLDGRLGVIQGSRRLNDLRETIGISHMDEDFASFVVIDSETDTLPVGDVRGRWSERALVQKDEEVKAAERLYRDDALEHCRKLIARFGERPRPR